MRTQGFFYTTLTILLLGCVFTLAYLYHLTYGVTEEGATIEALQVYNLFDDVEESLREIMKLQPSLNRTKNLSLTFSEICNVDEDITTTLTRYKNFLQNYFKTRSKLNFTLNFQSLETLPIDFLLQPLNYTYTYLDGNKRTILLYNNSPITQKLFQYELEVDLSEYNYLNSSSNVVIVHDGIDLPFNLSVLFANQNFTGVYRSIDSSVENNWSFNFTDYSGDNGTLELHVGGFEYSNLKREKAINLTIFETQGITPNIPFTLKAIFKNTNATIYINTNSTLTFDGEIRRHSLIYLLEG